MNIKQIAKQTAMMALAGASCALISSSPAGVVGGAVFGAVGYLGGRQVLRLADSLLGCETAALVVMALAIAAIGTGALALGGISLGAAHAITLGVATVVVDAGLVTIWREIAPDLMAYC